MPNQLEKRVHELETTVLNLQSMLLELTSCVRELALATRELDGKIEAQTAVLASSLQSIDEDIEHLQNGTQP